MFDRIFFASFASYEKRPDIAVEPLLFRTELECAAHIARMDARTDVPGVVTEMFGQIVRRMARVRVTELDEAETACECGHDKSEHSSKDPGNTCCLVEKSESPDGEFADDCVTFRPKHYNAHEPLV